VSILQGSKPQDFNLENTKESREKYFGQGKQLNMLMTNFVRRQAAIKGSTI
jgi:hypothetical protein